MSKNKYKWFVKPRSQNIPLSGVMVASIVKIVLQFYWVLIWMDRKMQNLLNSANSNSRDA